MSLTSQTILNNYQVRKSRKQKAAFSRWATETAQAAGYEPTIEKGLFGARNIVIGNPETAKVIYTAHYDTCVVLPFPNFATPKNPTIFFLYQFVLALIIVAVPAAVAWVLHELNIPGAFLIYELLLTLSLAFMLFGPANKHTANDNTSGTAAIMEIISKMPASTNQTAAFILFDLEETGLFGSISYRLKHNKMVKDKLLINFDCISDGKHILIKANGPARRFVPLLEQNFKSDETFTVEIATRGVTYPSDQEMFPCGVGVAALKRSRFFNMLYMNRIHTPRDTVFQEENIEFLTDGAVSLAKSIQKPKTPNVPAGL